MKGFIRKEPLFSLCGLNCGLCVMHLGGYCPGCGGGEGNQSCAIARCSLQHGKIQFCWECSAYPCSHYEGFDAYDSFLPHSRRQEDIRLAQSVGLDAYLRQLRLRMDVLDELLAAYNDGRHKTFFATAVYLLDLADLQAVMEQLRASSVPLASPFPEDAAKAAALLQSAAAERGVCLKLVKRSK